MSFTVGPARPLFAKDVTKVKAEIEDLEGKVQAHVHQLEACRENLRSAKELVSSIEAGRIKRSLTAARKELAKAKRELKKGEQKEEEVPKWHAEIEKKQTRLDNNDEAMKAYLAYAGNQGSQSARAQAQSGVVYTGTPANTTNGAIRKTTQMVPRAPAQDVVNRSLQRQATAAKFAALKRRAEGGIAKGQQEKKVNQEDARKKAASKKKSSSVRCDSPSTKKSAEAQEKAASSPGSAAPVAAVTTSATKKRKLADLPEHDEQHQAKKNRSIPDQDEKKRPANPPRKTRSAVARKHYSSSIAAAKEKSGEQDAPPSDAEGESSEEDSLSSLFGDDDEMPDVDDIYEAPAEEHAGDKAAPNGDSPAAPSSLKRKADDSEDGQQSERLAKKAHLSEEASSPEEQGEKSKEREVQVPPQNDADQVTSDEETEQKKASESRAEVYMMSKGSRAFKWMPANFGKTWIKAETEPTKTYEVDTPLKDDEGNREYKLRGLLNIKNACFANSAIQLLNSALSYEQIRALRGEEPLYLFGFRYRDFDNAKDLQKLRSNISITAAMKGDIKVAPYLGQLLLDMREGVSHKSKKKHDDSFVTPTFFQQVFAYGCGKKEDRTMFDGQSQEDSHEYIMKIIDAIAEEGHSFMRDIFKVDKKSTNKCIACGEESDSKTSELEIHVKTADGATTNEEGQSTAERKLKVRDLIDRSMAEKETPQDSKCEKCGAEGRHEKTTTITGLAKTFMVSVDCATGANSVSAEKKMRGGNADSESALSGKDTTAIEIDFEGVQVEFGEDKYSVASVLRHQGRKSINGHYDALIQHGGSWNHLDDDEVQTNLSNEEMADAPKRQCSIIPLRKMDL